MHQKFRLKNQKQNEDVSLDQMTEDENNEAATEDPETSNS